MNNGISGREVMPTNDGGMGINGTWINKRTGQTVNVINSVMDGNDMIIISDKGQISMAEFSQDYIQTSEEIYNEAGQVVGKEPINTDDLKQIQEYEHKTTIPEKQNKTAQPKKNNIKNENLNIIKKVFDKLTSFPKITIDISWDEFPEAQIHTLVDFLDVSIDDISSYIIQNYANTKSLTNDMKQIIKNKLEKNIVSEKDDNIE